MAKFFISYSRHDAAFADMLRRNILRVDNAHDVFIDRFGLTAGSNIEAALTKRIEWCDYFFLILSPTSLKSRWVKYELKRIKQRERTTGEKKLFVVQPRHLALAKLPKNLADNLILEFTGEENLPAEFFRLMHAVYANPTYYSVGSTVRNDPEEGYLVDLQIKCDDVYLKLIDWVEYRFDYEFGLVGWNSDILEGAVHPATNRRARFSIKGLWTNTSIVVFVAIYLKNTRVVYLKETIEVGAPVN